ncbi:MAG: AraC family transcriptional regulator, partial [Bacteroidota bacterium]
MTTRLVINNMVSNRCIQLVREQLLSLGHSVSSIKLGSVEIRGPLQEPDYPAIIDKLGQFGFELIRDTDAE